MKATYLVIAISLTGCAHIWDHSHQYTSQAFERELTREIEIGVTTPNSILAMFDEPSSKNEQTKSGEELWQYDNFGNRDISFLLLPILDIDLKTDQLETLFIKFEDNVVIDYWIINDERSKVIEVANQQLYSRSR